MMPGTLRWGGAPRAEGVWTRVRPEGVDAAEAAVSAMESFISACGHAGRVSVCIDRRLRLPATAVAAKSNEIRTQTGRHGPF